MSRDALYAETFSDSLIIFKRFYDQVEYILTHLEVGFQERNCVFTVIRINPHAVLEANESYSRKCGAHSRPELASVVRYIENEYSPFSVPTPRLVYPIPRSFKTTESSFSFWRQTELFLPPFKEPLRSKSVARTSYDFPASAGLYDAELCHRPDYIWSNEKHAYHSCRFYGFKYQFLQLVFPRPPLTTRLQFSHTPILTGRCESV